MTSLFSDPYLHPIVSSWISENTFDVKKRAITAAIYNIIVQMGSITGNRMFYFTFFLIFIALAFSPPIRELYLIYHASRNLPSRRLSLLLPRKQNPCVDLCSSSRGLYRPASVAELLKQRKGEKVVCAVFGRAGSVPRR